MPSFKVRNGLKCEPAVAPDPTIWGVCATIAQHILLVLSIGIPYAIGFQHMIENTTVIGGLFTYIFFMLIPLAWIIYKEK